MPEGNSATQLRREAAKARALAANAFAEEERRTLIGVAASLDREAAAIEVALALRRVSAGRQSRPQRRPPPDPKS